MPDNPPTAIVLLIPCFYKMDVRIIIRNCACLNLKNSSDGPHIFINRILCSRVTLIAVYLLAEDFFILTVQLSTRA